MRTNETIKTDQVSEGASSKLQQVINRLKSAVRPPNNKTSSTEIDYYHRYVFPNRLEDKVEVLLKNGEKHSQRV